MSRPALLQRVGEFLWANATRYSNVLIDIQDSLDSRQDVGEVL